MKKIFLGLALLICGFADAKETPSAVPSTAGSPPYVVKFHVELKDWPTDKEAAVTKAVNQLIDSQSCWSMSAEEHRGFKKIDLREVKDGCHQFVWFENIENLKPWKRIRTDVKMTLTYKDLEGEEDRMDVQIFKWDGKKLQRIRNSGSLIGKRDLQDLILLWSFK